MMTTQPRQRLLSSSGVLQEESSDSENERDELIPLQTWYVLLKELGVECDIPLYIHGYSQNAQLT